MTTYLLDANVLIALAVPQHVHHERCDRWLASIASFATCPITQGAVVRFLVRSGELASDAQRWLEAVAARTDHAFWPDAIPFAATDLTDVSGHRQVTDAYLRSLALARGSLVATLDEPMSRLPGGFLIPRIVPRGL